MILCIRNNRFSLFMPNCNVKFFVESILRYTLDTNTYLRVYLDTIKLKEPFNGRT